MPKVKEILKRVKKIDLKTNRLVEGLMQGAYKSVFKGRGIEFSEVREYVPGDDIRTIDWNVTARFNTPYIKEYIEERDLDIYIVFDISSSNNYGSTKSKKELGYEIASSIMFSAIKNNDNVGICLFSDGIEYFIKPRKGKKHVLRLIREMIYYEPQKKGTNINRTLLGLGNIIKRKSIIFIMSDFVSNDFLKSLKILKNRHDVVLVNLYDNVELDIPDIGYAYIEDEETGEQVLVDTGDENFRSYYLKQSKRAINKLISLTKKISVDFIDISTSEEFYIPLIKFFKLREKRQRWVLWVLVF